MLVDKNVLSQIDSTCKSSLLLDEHISKMQKSTKFYNQPTDESIMTNVKMQLLMMVKNLHTCQQQIRYTPINKCCSRKPHVIYYLYVMGI